MGLGCSDILKRNSWWGDVLEEYKRKRKNNDKIVSVLTAIDKQVTDNQPTSSGPPTA
jgi:hypothetical protein